MELEKTFQAVRQIIERLDKSLGRKDVCQKTMHLLRQSIEHYNWVGVYWVSGEELVLGEWEGPAATQHTRIPLSQGVCGFSARAGEVVVVPDVSKDPRYLQCFLNTRSEIVVPIAREGKVIGVLDIDSDRIAPFGKADEEFLKWLTAWLSDLVEPA